MTPEERKVIWDTIMLLKVIELDIGDKLGDKFFPVRQQRDKLVRLLIKYKKEV